MPHIPAFPPRWPDFTPGDPTGGQPPLPSFLRNPRGDSSDQVGGGHPPAPPGVVDAHGAGGGMTPGLRDWLPAPPPGPPLPRFLVRPREAEPAQPGNPGESPDPNPAERRPGRVRLVGVGPPPPPPGVKPVEERPRRRGLPPGTRVALITPEERQRMLDLRAEGLEYREIADRMGRALSVVWRNINLPEPRRRAITPQRQQEAMLLRRMGLTLAEIGSRLRLDPSMVLYILHRAGESVDLIAEADRLNRRLLGVSASLRPPATYDKLVDAAERVRRIADDAALISEITPEEVPRPLQDYPFEIGWTHSRALWAQELLYNGAWCLLQVRLERLPAVRERLEGCAEAGLFLARGVIEGKEGYEVKAEQTVRQIEAIMAEAEVLEEVPARVT